MGHFSAIPCVGNSLKPGGGSALVVSSDLCGRPIKVSVFFLWEAANRGLNMFSVAMEIDRVFS